MDLEDNSFLNPRNSFNSEASGDLEEIFTNLDRSGSGFLEKSDFENLCQNLELDGEEVEAVFRELDKDGDRRISLHEFTDGLKHVEVFIRQRAVSSPAVTGRTSSPVTREAWGLFSHRSGRDLFLLPSQDNVCELYQQLHGSATHLLPQFETVVLSIIKDYRSHQTEIDRLEKSLKRANETHEQHLRQMEEEMDQQISRAEEKCRQQEKERLELDLEEERRRWEAEKVELQASVKKLQKMEANARKDKSKEDSVGNLKRKLENLMQENRKLKSSLTESNTNAAVLKSELTQLQAEFEEKCEDLDRWERNSLLDYVTEQQSLSRQLEMLQNTNKKLNDTNDSLRESLGRGKRSSNRPSRTPSPFLQRDRDGSVMSDYMMTPEPDMSPELLRSLRGSFSSLEDLTACDPGKRKCSNDIDSGHSTMKDPEESDNEFTQSTAISGLGKHSGTESEIDDSKTEAPDSQDEAMESEGEADSQLEHRHKGQGRQAVTTVQRQHSTRVLPQAPRKIVSAGNVAHVAPSRQVPPVSASSQVLSSTTAPADQKMFKVVLAGDAAVGKSSFILRLCKNEFRPNMNSTLGVDFQMKTMVIDDTPVTLQIWDTAGQERFRSIAKSYFRRADGVLLLYDCTYEPSFVHVREWVDAVEDGAPRTLPIMLCANKLDLRNDAIKSGQKVILKGHGEEMAREHGALFCETSAKEGDNVQDAVEKLMRQMMQMDSDETRSNILDLNKKEEKKSKCCGGS
ncbi:PREDICTED: ras and EF-hand domain-containing protein homolog isoform X2 [Branchiostoma belcheri]|uniref:Ras and EF-hand domain-containing protein homolog isoform X1 n=3 Tax=Branchiostoma belcheri TaxID=7741 RepID=A0A6P4YGQ2_BRABE|nr:PREDICTED: ras and EF-hand domain-containing protein homolog isoform X1 [Branchiostoma belcheri]XP_019621099.1 PREDICTED: ras and EF-hand domain-containing protein homolog isoform X2 [Branchiostoma belcheri]